MIASLLVLAVGLTDVVRSFGRRRGARWAGIVAAWAGVVVLAVWGLGVHVLVALACVAGAAGWALAMPLDDRPRPRRLWPVAALALVVAVVTVYDAADGSAGFLVDAYDAARLPALDGVPLRTALAAVAVGVFLTTSGNIGTRAALGRAERPVPGAATTTVTAADPTTTTVAAADPTTTTAGATDGSVGSMREGSSATGRTHARARARAERSTAPAAAGGWVLRVAGRVVGTVEPPRTEAGLGGGADRPGPSAADGENEGSGPARTPRPATSTLRGGRLIGPLERILVAVLALGGAYAVIAAVLAAKGIVRFPEISEDRRTGSKAEEFLIGSLASWSVSAAAVVYLVVLSPA